MKLVHTMLRANDLDKSLDFYTKVLGLELRSRNDFEKGKFTLAFLRVPGAGPEAAEIELTYNWGREQPYDRGNAYGHLAFTVESFEPIEQRLQERGMKWSWGPGLTPSGTRRMAWLDDPDGYEIELLEAPK